MGRLHPSQSVQATEPALAGSGIDAASAVAASSEKPKAALKKLLPLLVTFVGLVLVALILLANAMATPSEPSIVLPCTMFLGEGSPGAELTNSFPLRNVGGAPLAFTIIGSCTCTKIEPAQGVVPPGGSVPISVALRLDSKPGTTRWAELQINTNDPDNSSAVYQVYGTSPPVLSVAPSEINFGRVQQGYQPSQRLRVRDSQGLPIRDASNHPRFSVSGRGFEVRQVKGGEDFTLAVSLASDLPQGEARGYLVLEVPDSGKIRKVPLSATVVGALSMVPARVFVREDVSDWQPTVLVWRTDGARLDGGLHVDAASGIDVHEVTAKDDGIRRRFVLRKSSSSTVADGAITFVFGSGGDALTAVLPVVTQVDDSIAGR